MDGVNTVLLIGRLGADPELKTAESGTRASFNLATNDSWTDKAGAKQERTEWHRVVAWGPLADTVGRFLHKGREVCVEGRLQTRKWTDKAGQTRYTTEVVARRVHFLGSRGEAGGGGQRAAAQGAA
jgi:single-strand DNA-binding protein